MSHKQLLSRRLVCLEFEQQHKLHHTHKKVGGRTATTTRLYKCKTIATGENAMESTEAEEDVKNCRFAIN